MKRRLHYAMPRVPIEKLKAGQDIEEVRDVETKEKKTSFIKAAATTLLKKVMRKRKQQEWEERNSDTSEDETHFDDTLFAEIAPIDNDKDSNNQDDELGEKGMRNQQKKNDEDAFPRQKYHQHFNITENAMKKMKDVEEMLQRANRGKKLRVVVVESDDGDDNEDDDAHDDMADNNSSVHCSS